MFHTKVLCEGSSFCVNSHTYQTGQKNILSLFWILDLVGKPQSACNVLDLTPKEINVREDKLRPFLNCTVSLLSEHILNFSNWADCRGWILIIYEFQSTNLYHKKTLLFLSFMSPWLSINICHFSFSITGVFLTKTYEYGHNDQNITFAVKTVLKNNPLPLFRWAPLNWSTKIVC